MPAKKKQRRHLDELAELLRSPFLDFCRTKLEDGDEHVVKLLRDFKTKQTPCIFCDCAFDPRSPGNCSVDHDVEWCDSERTAHGTWGSRYEHQGKCTRCGDTVTDDTENEEAEFDNPGVCYRGPHRSTRPAGSWKGDSGSDPGVDEDEEGEEEDDDDHYDEGRTRRIYPRTSVWVATSYHAVGSFSDWNISTESFCPDGHRIVVGRDAPSSGSLRREEFQIVGDSDWNKRVYPAGGNNDETVTLRNGEPAAAGKDEGCGHGRNWAIEGQPGATFLVFFDPGTMTVTCFW